MNNDDATSYTDENIPPVVVVGGGDGLLENGASCELLVTDDDPSFNGSHDAP